MSSELVLSIANRDCVLVKGAPVLLGSGKQIRSIKSEHLGAILNYMPRLASEVIPKSKCVIVEGVEDDMAFATARSLQVAVTFALNFFSNSGSILIGRAFLLRRRKLYKVTDYFEFATSPTITSSMGDKFRLLGTTKPTDIQNLFESCSASLSKEPSLRVTLSRFNSAILKNQIEDQAIDLSICLESIFSVQTEVSFRFALYNTLMSVQEIPGRLEPFRLLKKLYKDRSNVVHGNAAEVHWSAEDWARLIVIAKAAIAYKIQYLRRFSARDWQEHLDKLVLGSAIDIWASDHDKDSD